VIKITERAIDVKIVWHEAKIKLLKERLIWHESEVRRLKGDMHGENLL
jgi:hypothetical protein